MNSRVKYPLLFLLVFTVFCYPIINSGYYGDDALNSFIGSIMAERNLTLADQYVINFKAFLPTRLSILHFYHWVFLVFTDLLAYKLYVCTIVGSALVSMYLVVNAIVKRADLSFFAIIFTLLIGIQFREYGDPVLVFHGATSISLVFLNISILLFIRSQKLSRKTWLVGSLIFFSLACLSYELMYPFCLIYFFITILSGQKSLTQGVKNLGLFLTPPMLLALPNIISRLLINTPKDVVDPNFHKAYEFSLNIGAIFLVFAKELVASLPLSNVIINPFSSLTVGNILLVSNTWALLLIILTGLFSTVFYYSLQFTTDRIEKNKADRTPRDQLLLLLFALMLLIVPNGIIALSPKYQGEIIWGSGYVSLYFGYFGVSILICLAIWILLERFRSQWILLVISLILGGISTVNFAANNKTVEVLNAFWKNPRTVAEDALRRGILAEIDSASAYMFINSNYPWDVTSFIHKYSGKSLNQEQYTGGEGRFFGGKIDENFLISDSKSKTYGKFSPRADQALAKYLRLETKNNYYFDTQGEHNIFYFDYYSDSDDSGYALLASVRKIFMSEARINGLASDRVKVYIRMPPQRGVYSDLSATFLALDPTTLQPLNTVTIQENQFKIISQGIGWKIVEISSDAHRFLIDIKSLRLNTSQKNYETSLFPEIFSDKRNFNFNAELRAELFHVGFAAPLNSSYIAFEPIKLGKDFSIVLSARLNENTVLSPYAHIAGNHPGKNNFEGFVIQKKPIGENVFDLHFGDGTSWRHVVDFTLRSDRDTFIGVSVKDGKVIGVVDKSVFKIDLGGDIHDSEMPLFIGNYVGKDRPFPGKVGELLITNTALPETVLQAFSKSVQGN